MNGQSGSRRADRAAGQEGTGARARRWRRRLRVVTIPEIIGPIVQWHLSWRDRPGTDVKHAS